MSNLGISLGYVDTEWFNYRRMRRNKGSLYELFVKKRELLLIFIDL